MAATTKDLLDNKEFTELMTVTGLKIGEKIKSLSQLRFGKLVMCADADADGNHICGLMMAGFKKFWPELFELGAIYRFQTPIMKVMIGKEEKYFYSLDQFSAWEKTNTKSFKTRYLKGLGSSTAEDFRGYFANMDNNLVQITLQSTNDLGIVDLVFGKEAGAADARKVWLDLE
jgi:DNA topoisomerase-2